MSSQEPQTAVGHTVRHEEALLTGGPFAAKLDGLQPVAELLTKSTYVRMDNDPQGEAAHVLKEVHINAPQSHRRGSEEGFEMPRPASRTSPSGSGGSERPCVRRRGEVPRAFDVPDARAADARHARLDGPRARGSGRRLVASSLRCSGSKALDWRLAKLASCLRRMIAG